MAISRGKIQDLEDVITLTFAGTDDVLNVWFKPQSITPRSQREMTRLQRQIENRQAVRAAARKKALEAGDEPPVEDDALDEEDSAATLGLLLSLLSRWDMLEFDRSDEHPHPPTVPISKDALEGLGWPILGRLMREMMETISDPTRGKPSASSTRVVDGAVISVNGTYSS